MPLDEQGNKWSCEPCLRGHRSSKCKHFDRLMVRVPKTGRPLKKCPHDPSQNCSCRRSYAVMRRLSSGAQQYFYASRTSDPLKWTSNKFPDSQALCRPLYDAAIRPEEHVSGTGDSPIASSTLAATPPAACPTAGLNQSTPILARAVPPHLILGAQLPPLVPETAPSMLDVPGPGDFIAMTSEVWNTVDDLFDTHSLMQHWYTLQRAYQMGEVPRNCYAGILPPQIDAMWSQPPQDPAVAPFLAQDMTFPNQELSSGFVDFNLAIALDFEACTPFSGDTSHIVWV